MFISEVVRGGAAELDGRLMQGDQILSVNSEDTSHASQEAVAATLKVTHASPSLPGLPGFIGSDQTHADTHSSRLDVCSAVRSWSRPVGAGTAQSCVLGFVCRKSGEFLLFTGSRRSSVVDSSLL